ncbi:hypothetical protein FOA43_003368 [Brettanomyces nanus]|uniref:Uncharacterized protein n=1 Tax=Eeniella nana TaxID=13502 RepID=A0A875S7S9_EENNA|nr:uncharacterized protein FOA43_003368 [Brettanomyces nanus]QPG75982.1 hypothetical protein FOA43_003368 [Brettanomyces nanus]
MMKGLFKDDILNYVYTFYKIDDEKRSRNRDRAIYILDPVSRYSIECLLADFSRGTRYKDTVVCFLPGLSPTNYKRLRQNKFLEEATVGGKFATIDYLSLQPVEHRVYVTGCTYSVPVYYNFQHLGRDLVQYQLDKSVDSMISLCVLTNEYPIVRFYNSPLSKQLAVTFQKKLDEYYRNHPQLAPVNSETVFLITERSMDIFGPFCHYKYYRSQLFDLMDDQVKTVRGDYTYVYDYNIKTGQGVEEKHLVFDTDDPVYSELKDLTVEDYTHKIVHMVNNLKKEDDRYNNLKFTSDLSHAALNQSEHMFNKQLVTGHFQLISKINDKFHEEQLLEAIVFENQCASNLGESKQLHEPVSDDLIKLLANEHLFMGNKIRLLIIYAISRGGLIESDYMKLLHFGMPEKVDSIMTLIKNLQKVGLNLLKPSLSEKRQQINTFFDIKNTQELTDRLIPTFSNIILRLAQNRLPELYNIKLNDDYYYGRKSGSGLDSDLEEDDKTFPYVKGAPVDDMESSMNNLSLGSSKSTLRSQPKWKSTRPSESKLTRQKLLIFCAGGLTQSELSAMISLEPTINKNIFIGTDELYSTWDLLGDIRLINDERSNFSFPLDQKFLVRKPPAFLYENSESRPSGSSSAVHSGSRDAGINRTDAVDASNGTAGINYGAGLNDSNLKTTDHHSHHRHLHNHHQDESTDKDLTPHDEKGKRGKLLRRFKSFGKSSN